MSKVSVRTLAGADARDYLAYSGPGSADVSDRFDRYMDSGRFRPEWMYVATRGGEVVARAAFFCTDDGRPVALDHVDIRPGITDPVEVGATMLRRTYDDVRGSDPLPDLHMFLPADWRSTVDADAISARIAAAEAAGLQVLVERNRFEWVAAGAPYVADAVSPELRVETAPADEVVVDVLRAVAVGSLDVGTRRSVEQLGVDGAARSYLDDMAALPGDREHWLLARDAAGVPVAIVIASIATQPHPQVAFVGVDPAGRGRGYGRALLAEATRRLAAAGADRVRADTDMTNTPMIEVFRQCGWHAWATRLVMQRPLASRRSSPPMRATM